MPSPSVCYLLPNQSYSMRSYRSSVIARCTLMQCARANIKYSAEIESTLYTNGEREREKRLEAGNWCRVWRHCRIYIHIEFNKSIYWIFFAWLWIGKHYSGIVRHLLEHWLHSGAVACGSCEKTICAPITSWPINFDWQFRLMNWSSVLCSAVPAHSCVSPNCHSFGSTQSFGKHNEVRESARLLLTLG